MQQVQLCLVCDSLVHCLQVGELTLVLRLVVVQWLQKLGIVIGSSDASVADCTTTQSFSKMVTMIKNCCVVVSQVLAFGDLVLFTWLITTLC
jgi:hypothetical protein